MQAHPPQPHPEAQRHALRALGPIDCDVHPAPPRTADLLPYLDEHWREAMVSRGIDGLDLPLYPPNAPISARPDFVASRGDAGTLLAALRGHVLEPWGTRAAILNCLHGAMALYSEDMGAALASAVNAWLAREWLDRDPRLRASIVVAARSPELAAAEIERRAADPRFVQVLMLVSGDMPLGRRLLWPIYAAAERHGLPIGIHPGSTYRHSTTSLVWPTYYIEDYTAYAQAFQSQLGSLITEGAFQKFPGLKVVLLESGVTWLPGLIWRADKTWRGVRFEVPWLKQTPGEVIRNHVRFTIQPFDAPPQREQLERVLDQLGSDDMLLFSTDYPHWHFDGDEAVPDGFPDALVRKILFDNPLKTYPRLSQTAHDSLEQAV